MQQSPYRRRHEALLPQQGLQQAQAASDIQVGGLRRHQGFGGYPCPLPLCRRKAKIHIRNQAVNYTKVECRPLHMIGNLDSDRWAGQEVSLVELADILRPI